MYQKYPMKYFQNERKIERRSIFIERERERTTFEKIERERERAQNFKYER